MNCLTIDFDIIMKPCIQLYNDLIDDNWTIPQIESNFPTLPLVLQPDFFIYEYITRFLIRVFKALPSNKVFFIKDHGTAGRLLDNYKNVNLTNIDHHHDIGYGATTARMQLSAPHTGDWVKYLKDKKIVTTYNWIGNSNSVYPKTELEPYIDCSIELPQIDLNKFVEQIDMLIICNSPEWIPSQYQTLWDIWVGIAEEWYGVEFEII